VPSNPPPENGANVVNSGYENSGTGSTPAAHPYQMVPEQLKIRRQWVRWRLENRKGKLTKIPLNPRTGCWASSTDPSTWGGFEEAVESRVGNGIGFGCGFTF